MDSRSLTYFLAVADHGSVSAAAQQSFVSQPAVSRQIAALERELGVRLFRRTATGMRLTPAGVRLRGMARDIQIRLRRAEEVMAALHEGQPQFTLVCPEATGNFFVAPYVAVGGPIADIVPARPQEVYAVLGEGADMALNTAPPPEHLAVRHLESVGIMVQDPGESEDGEAGAVELAEVAQGPLLVPGYGSAVERSVRQIASAAGIALDLVKTTSNGPLAQAKAAAGQGSALVIEPVQYGLHARPLVHQGEALIVDLYAAWEPDHYATTSLAKLAVDLGQWIRSRERSWASASGRQDRP